MFCTWILLFLYFLFFTFALSFVSLIVYTLKHIHLLHKISVYNVVMQTADMKFKAMKCQMLKSTFNYIIKYLYQQFLWTSYYRYMIYICTLNINELYRDNNSAEIYFHDAVVINNKSMFVQYPCLHPCVLSVYQTFNVDTFKY